jgi:hypothetical protein
MSGKKGSCEKRIIRVENAEKEGQTGKVDNEQVDDELADLEGCQCLFIPRLVSWEGGCGKVILQRRIEPRSISV